MSHIDKFVLLPYNRYERLLKSNTTNEDSQKQTSNTLTHPLPQDKLEEQETEQEEETSKQNTKSRKQDNTTHPTQKQTIPGKPPGIPQNNKNQTFKWHSLF